MKVSFRLNGAAVEVETGPDARAIDILREKVGLMGAKLACGIGRCGACTVIVDGRAVNACLLMAYRLDGSNVLTIEGLSQLREGRAVMEAFSEGNAFQCGYCAPGMTMALTALLLTQPDAGDDAIREALGGNLCRCTGYHSILRGAADAVERLRATHTTAD